MYYFIFFYLLLSYYLMVTSDLEERKPFEDIETFGDLIWSLGMFPAHSIKILTKVVLENINTFYVYLKNRKKF